MPFPQKIRLEFGEQVGKSLFPTGPFPSTKEIAISEGGVVTINWIAGLRGGGDNIANLPKPRLLLRRMLPVFLVILAMSLIISLLRILSHV